jgi:hypothetical protein
MPAPGADVEALFVPEGNVLLPTEFTIGPWRPDALHGSVVAALMASALDDPDRNFARLTVDLFGSVPMRPLRLDLEPEVGGRKVQRRSAVLSDDGRLLARATALYLTHSEVEIPEAAEVAVQHPGDLEPLPESRAGWPGFESRAMALRTERTDQGSMRGWFQLLVPAVAGQPLTPLQSASAAADYTSGGTNLVLSLKRWVFMSVDLTVNFSRRPTGNWVALESPPSMLGELGVGIASGVLHDARGLFARVAQTQLIQKAPA